MRLEELELVCQEAARNLVERRPRALPAVVLPLAEATRVVTMPDFPDDDPARFDLLAAFARETVRPANAPCYGFVAEAVAEADGEAVDVVVIAYGARRHRARVTAAPLLAAEAGADVEIGEFTASEELDPTAMPFLSPLQHAVDEAEPPEDGGGIGGIGDPGGIGGMGGVGGGLPIINGG